MNDNSLSDTKAPAGTRFWVLEENTGQWVIGLFDVATHIDHLGQVCKTHSGRETIIAREIGSLELYNMRPGYIARRARKLARLYEAKMRKERTNEERAVAWNAGNRG